MQRAMALMFGSLSLTFLPTQHVANRSVAKAVLLADLLKRCTFPPPGANRRVAR
jgi:hypothetical protein